MLFLLVYYYHTAFDPLLDEELRGDRCHVSLILYKLDP